MKKATFGEVALWVGLAEYPDHGVGSNDPGYRLEACSTGDAMGRSA
ncbi:hypothetical protein [Aeromonas sp. sif2416]|nr:hypothetical protein [Aeromonas sp. sif2416]MBV7437066.1 hypothetical protein [Aeromonas sp. sif2416]